MTEGIGFRGEGDGVGARDWTEPMKMTHPIFVEAAVVPVLAWLSLVDGGLEYASVGEEQSTELDGFTAKGPRWRQLI